MRVSHALRSFLPLASVHILCPYFCQYYGFVFSSFWIAPFRSLSLSAIILWICVSLRSVSQLYPLIMHVSSASLAMNVSILYRNLAVACK
jgi:hypothetical protein